MSFWKTKNMVAEEAARIRSEELARIQVLFAQKASAEHLARQMVSMFVSDRWHAGFPLRLQHAAKQYGEHVTTVEDVLVFSRVGFAYVDQFKGESCYWSYLEELNAAQLSVVDAFLDHYTVSSAQEAIDLCKSTGAASPWSGSVQSVEGKLMNQAFPYLNEKSDILDFALSLTAYKSLMALSIGLGFTPSETFEKAIEHHKRDLEHEEKERQRQQQMMASAI